MSEIGSLGVGVIGCGNRIRNAILPAVLGPESGARLVALCDPSPDSIRYTRDRFNPDAKVYDDYHSVVLDPAVDWVVIGSWNCFHAEQAIAALDAGKHVFCEKPMVTTMEQAMALRAAVERNNRKFVLGMVLRYSPVYRKIHEIVSGGGLGRPISMEANETLDLGHGAAIITDWRRLEENSGGHLLEKCCHDIDLINWFLNSIPVRVASFGGTEMFTPANNPLCQALIDSAGDDATLDQTRRNWRDGMKRKNPMMIDKDVVDHQIVLFEYANGTRLSFHTNCSVSIPERRLLICGTEGTLRCDSRIPSIEFSRLSLRNELDAPVERFQHFIGELDLYGHAGGDAIMYRELVETMRHGAPAPAGIVEGLRSGIAIFAAEEARKTGKVVDIRPYWERAGIDWRG